MKISLLSLLASAASRLIHDNKLILGPYIINDQGGIREWRVYPDMGRQARQCCGQGSE